MSPKPEDKARKAIDKILEQAGWYVCDINEANINAHRGLQHIHLEDLRADCIPLAPILEQKQIIEEIEADVETNLKRAERLRQAILKKAFSGRLVQ